MTVVAGPRVPPERPVWLVSGEERVFGMLTEPAVPPTGLGVVCLHARNRNNTAHRNRTGLRLAQRLSRDGASVLRVDFHGTGDSTGVLQLGVGGQSVQDVLVAAEHLRDAGATRIGLTGICYGGMVALAAAESLPDLAGLMMVSPPFASMARGQTIKHQHARASVVARQALTPRTLRLLARDAEYRTWLAHRVRVRLQRTRARRHDLSPSGADPSAAPAASTPGAAPLERATGGLVHVLGRRAPVSLLFAEANRVYEDFVSAARGPLGRLLEDPCLEVQAAPGNEFGLLTSLAGQEWIVDCTLEWARRCGAARPA